MKRKAFVILLVFSLGVCCLFSGCKNNTAPVDASGSLESSSSTEPTSETEPQTSPVIKDIDPVTITVTAVGDMLMHAGASSPAAMPDGSYNYDYLFANVKDKIQAADLAIVNEEVIFGGNEKGNIGYPTFNVRTELGTALVNAGFDAVLFATNHTLDQHASGVLNTINFWKTTHPDTTYLGIHESYEDSQNITVKDIDGIKVALLNYTYGLNGFSLPEDMPYLVDLMNEYTRDEIADDLARANELADFVIVLPHWGTEYVLTETEEQQQWAQFFADNGADLIIGTHPHVVEPVKWIEGSNGNK
ncbi:MAG: CapA family protein, partial [Butyrivibrio sp.]